MEHLLEYQDYLLAYRLRTLVGGRARPKSPLLGLSSYAARRLERQRLARELLGARDYHGRLRRVDELTDELNFGFWHNPSESVGFLRQVGTQGGCSAIATPERFVAELLSEGERAALQEDGALLVARYYLGLLRSSAACQDAEAFTRLRGEFEPLRVRLPLFAFPCEGEAPPVNDAP